MRLMMHFDISSKRACICCISPCTCDVTSCVPPWGTELATIAAGAAAEAGVVGVTLVTLLLREPVAFGGIVDITIVVPSDKTKKKLQEALENDGVRDQRKVKEPQDEKKMKTCSRKRAKVVS